VSKDINGNDINAVPNFNFLSVQSRLSFSWSGTEALGAKVSALIEGDFFAQSDVNINLFRLRHAYVKFNWTSSELLFGQYWIPMFTSECFPGTVSFNTGTPINPFGRNPQIRFTETLGDLKLVAVASSQRDYTSRGPGGTTGQYMRNAALPELTGEALYKAGNLSAGAGVAYKQIVPQTVTALAIATTEKVKSMSAMAFVNYSNDALSFKLKGIYGQNTPDYLNISGFAVTDINILTGEQTYEPLSNYSIWTDISTKGESFQYGFFGGYTASLGTKSDIAGAIYGLGTNIASLYRVAPRVIYNAGKIRLAAEAEYTVANYGTAFDSKNVATKTEAASNFRLLMAVYYFF
jgi:hypothetical protein